MPARILVIEDDMASRDLASYLLEAAGYATFAASDGSTGVGLALAESPDLILCDLHLPVMNGFEILECLLENKAWRRVPIVALTASSMVGDREKTLAAGFDDYLSKPITPQTFIEEIERYLPAALKVGGVESVTNPEVPDGQNSHCR